MATNHSFLITTLLFLSLLLLSPVTSAFRCRRNDYRTLMKIKTALNNPYQLASWIPNTDCCNWLAMECDEQTGKVTQLTISSGEISAQIPSAIGDLLDLEVLVLRKLTNLTGPIPRSITKLKKLRWLRLSWLNLSGPVPGFLSELQNLQFLELNFNKFSGSIPASFSKFTKLGALHLDRNQLTGPIPESFGHFAGLVPSLYLSHNQLTGQIPKSLGNMNFESVDFSRNKLVGDASMLFRPNGSLQYMNLSRNLLEFDFSKVKFPKTLVSMDLNHNKIYGSIPKEMNDLPELRSFNVAFNRLCGKIPSGENFQNFDASCYTNNKCLCGAPLQDCKS